MITVPAFKSFKKTTEAIAYHSWGDDYDTMYRATTKYATFEIWHEEEEYGNDAHGWQSRILIHGKYNNSVDCGTKCLSPEDAYVEMVKKASRQDVHPAPQTKKQLDLERRIKETEQKYIEYNNKHSIKMLSSDFIGCKECGSRLKRELLHSEYCPLCRNDLRSKTTIDTLKGYQNKIKKLQKELDASF